MNVSLQLIIAVVTLLVLGGFCLWGNRDLLLKWDAEVRQSMGQKPPERTPKWERDVTLVGIISLGLAVVFVVVFGFVL